MKNRLTQPLTEKSEMLRILVRHLNKADQLTMDAKQEVTKVYTEMDDGIEKMAQQIMFELNRTRTKILRLRTKLMELDYDENHR